jgi:hypothetical protein
MELYIAEYLVENRFADDIVSALKILKVVSDDWYGELINEVLTPEERAQRRAARAQRMKDLGKTETDAETAAQIRAGIRSGGASARGGRPQTPSSGVRGARDPRLGPTQQQRQADAAATRMVGSVEKGATVIRRNSDGTTTRVSANFTRDPLNIRSDATRSERRSGTSRPTPRPEVGRWSQDREAENAPETFRKKNK